MSMSDPIADMLTRIRNANSQFHEEVAMPHSKLKEQVAKLLKEQGFVSGYRVEPASPGQTLIINLKYVGGRKPKLVLNVLRRVSKPGIRKYVNKTEIPRVLGGMGIAIISTSQGLMTGQEARKRGIGGEVLAQVW